MGDDKKPSNDDKKPKPKLIKPEKADSSPAIKAIRANEKKQKPKPTKKPEPGKKPK